MIGCSSEKQQEEDVVTIVRKENDRLKRESEELRRQGAALRLIAGDPDFISVNISALLAKDLRFDSEGVCINGDRAVRQFKEKNPNLVYSGNPVFRRGEDGRPVRVGDGQNSVSGNVTIANGSCEMSDGDLRRFFDPANCAVQNKLALHDIETYRRLRERARQLGIVG